MRPTTGPWPRDDEIFLAMQLGHEIESNPNIRAGIRGCSCGWVPNNSSLTNRLLAANHIWIVIADRIRKEQRPKLPNTPGRDSVGIARLRGHEPLDEKGRKEIVAYASTCSGCTWTRWSTARNWIDHANDIADKALTELDELINKMENERSQ